ncbi:MAG: hypothetical protein JXA03_02660, partial [Bacteroidales bacterium]|nr:hypothetical protein [Bacteroidales bacterium]
MMRRGNQTVWMAVLMISAALSCGREERLPASPGPDSLILRHSVTDSLLASAATIRDSDRREALRLSEAALHSAQMAGYEKGMAAAMKVIGTIHFFTGSYDSALNWYDNALRTY